MSDKSIKGFAYSGKLQDLNDSSYERLEPRFATVLPVTSNRAALDVVSMGYHLVGASDRVAEAGSDDKQIILTAHGAKKGDLIRLKTTANPIDEVELAINSIPDANTIILEGVLSADISTGDTFDILRAVPQRFDDTGASLASVVSPPVQFTKDGASVTVTEDTVTPANNIPFPVKLIDTAGDINITAGDLNVQLQHTGANPDSVQIGDGTETLAINADGSINVNFSATDLDIRDLDAAQDNVAISDGADTLAINADGSINTNISATDLDIRDLSAAQDNVAISDGTDTLAINADGSINTTISATDLDIRDLSAAQDNVAISDGTDTLAVNANGSINVEATNLDIRQLVAGSDNVAISDGTDTLGVNADGSINVVTTATDLDVRDLSAAQDNVAISDGTDQLAINADGSINVVSSTSGGKTAVDFLRNDYTVTNVTTGAFVEVKAALAQTCSEIEIFDSSGQTLELAIGGSGSEVVQFRIFPGGNGRIPVSIAAASRITIRAVSATEDAGEININFYQ